MRRSALTLERKEDAAFETRPAAHVAVPHIPNVNLYDQHVSRNPQDH